MLKPGHRVRIRRDAVHSVSAKQRKNARRVAGALATVQNVKDGAAVVQLDHPVHWRTTKLVSCLSVETKYLVRL